ncbi:zinc finger protein 250-like [Microcaecilia unicolor]|uniref:Zinc finger protein 250-like n=1 Tax=Microcaecilia unicolor TaxID=1415580 RepID=A0A6P7WXJ6_9AMPH|nr:zinc finger protein 250-like [Microcaecilia unicolor]
MSLSVSQCRLQRAAGEAELMSFIFVLSKEVNLQINKKKLLQFHISGSSFLFLLPALQETNLQLLFLSQRKIPSFLILQTAKAERKMPAGSSAQKQVTFEDIAVSFSQDEWEYLDEEQKELYREVMKENHQTLMSLGTGSPTVIPDIISHIERGEELYVRDEPGSEERETGKSSCSANQLITQERKREKNQGEDPVAMEQIQRQSENVCENIFEGRTRRNTRNRQQNSEGKRDLAADSLDGVSKRERCYRKFTNIHGHQRHLAERPFQNNSGYMTSNLDKGEEKRKKDPQEFTCIPSTTSICFNRPKSFPRFSKLQMQKKSRKKDIGEKRFPCGECNKSFLGLSYLKSHQMIHTGEKPFTCPECHKSFNRLSTLKNHQRIHKGEKPFICTECNKRFTQLPNLKSHQIIHKGDKPFTCSKCKKSFARLSGLKSHEMIHTGEKLFTCSECKKTFAQLPHLKKSPNDPHRRETIYV